MLVAPCSYGNAPCSYGNAPCSYGNGVPLVASEGGYLLLPITIYYYLLLSITMRILLPWPRLGLESGRARSSFCALSVEAGMLVCWCVQARQAPRDLQGQREGSGPKAKSGKCAARSSRGNVRGQCLAGHGRVSAELQVTARVFEGRVLRVAPLSAKLTELPFTPHLGCVVGLCAFRALAKAKPCSSGSPLSSECAEFRVR